MMISKSNLKYANEKIQSVIAETYNTKTKSEDFPREIKTKLLIPWFWNQENRRNLAYPEANHVAIHPVENNYHDTAERNLGPGCK